MHIDTEVNEIGSCEAYCGLEQLNISEDIACNSIKIALNDNGNPM